MKLVRKNTVVRLRPVKSDVAGVIRALGEQAHEISAVAVVYETKDGQTRLATNRMKNSTRLWLAAFFSRSTNDDLFGGRE